MIIYNCCSVISELAHRPYEIDQLYSSVQVKFIVPGKFVLGIILHPGTSDILAIQNREIKKRIDTLINDKLKIARMRTSNEH